jgi:hypothetical protein
VILPYWDRMDCVVLLWIYGAISNDLMETVLQPGASTLVIWLAIECQFLRNRE